jgi:hypothetical protein
MGGSVPTFSQAPDYPRHFSFSLSDVMGSDTPSTKTSSDAGEYDDQTNTGDAPTLCKLLQRVLRIRAGRARQRGNLHKERKTKWTAELSIASTTRSTSADLTA